MVAMVDYGGGYAEYMGVSTDQKPTEGLAAGIFVETDTGDVYFFNNGTWTKQFSFQS